MKNGRPILAAQRSAAKPAQTGDQGGQFLKVEAGETQDDGALRIGISLHADLEQKRAKACLQIEEHMLNRPGICPAHSILGVDKVEMTLHPKLAALALGEG